MPFAYYGAKHRLSAKYEAPRYDTIIEPFAGSAGYSVRYADPDIRVILVEKDPAVCELWREVLTLTSLDLDLLETDFEEGSTTHPLIGSMSGSSGLEGTLSGKRRQITPRMRKDWSHVRRRIERALPKIRHWEIIEGGYGEAPDLEATWFIDPPYQPLVSSSGDLYRFGSSGIDYQELGRWCTSRRGQVIVCEQHPADWLPFTRLTEQYNAAATSGSLRTEVFWTNDYHIIPPDTEDPQ